MVAIRVGDVSMGTLDDTTYARVLDAATPTGGRAGYPNLFALADPVTTVEPLELLDELARLAGTEGGVAVAVHIGALRDDLMAAVATAGEG